jgi:hypothetical protein
VTTFYQLFQPPTLGARAQEGNQYASMVTNHEACTLYWEGGGKSLTIPLGDKDNVTTMQLTPGYTKFHSFCNKALTNSDLDPIIMYPAPPISNNEGDEQDDQVDNWDEER